MGQMSASALSQKRSAKNAYVVVDALAILRLSDCYS